MTTQIPARRWSALDCPLVFAMPERVMALRHAGESG
jgi:hypothetical protein